ncbi:daple-like protein [Dendronephthya gigantea]|uniref:daple-like protein n=1 Tax=Dendronephthya gigantea TaxID=151771 RepID=UPI00106D7C80|nr:daple-like protein [Dendronephthya gigantea]
MDTDRSTQVLKTPLVLWIRTFSATAVADLTDLVDGYLLNKVMTEIDPTYFGLTLVHSNVYADINLRIHNLEHLLRSLKNYYKEKLQQVIVMDSPDVFVIAKDPESDESIEELNKILLLILGCAVQCDRKDFFVEKITTMDESIQQELVIPIREITENFDKVFSFQPSEVAALSHDDLLSYCGHMYDQMILLVNQRDANAEEIHQLLADRIFMTKEVNGNVSRVGSPPLSPTNSDFIQAEKTKLKKATEELEEKNLLIQELRDELESNKTTLETLVQENKSLSETSRFVNAYRDQLDVLKVKAEKVNKLENEIIKYKEKLMEMDVLKKRKEELEEQNELLYNTKAVLEKQINALNSKAEKLAETEREVGRLKHDLKDALQEKKTLQTRNRRLLEENAVVMLEAQNSLAEVSSLSSELSMAKDKDGNAEGTCLASEYNQLSSTQLLKLENENHRLKVIIAELTQHRESAVPQTMVSEEAVLQGAYEQTTEHDEGVSEGAEVRIVERQSSVRKTLPAKDSALSIVREKLQQKEEFANKISESLSTMEQENSELQDRIQQVMAQKRRSDQLIQRKSEDVTELERRLEEVTAERQKCEATLRQKSREINELTNNLSEFKEDKERSVEAKEKKTKDLNDLKERMDVLLSEKEKLGDTLVTKDKKLVDLENRLQRVEEANKELVQTLESQRDKISSQERRVAELLSAEKEEERKYSETIREKDRRIKEFERRISHLIEIEAELEKLNYTLKQKDRKADGFLKTIEEKDQEIVRLENRIEDENSKNNKLVYNLELREKKVESLEQRLEKVESKAEKQESNDDKIRREILETKDDKILELESRLEDALTHCKKLQHTLKVKDEKIVSLETRLEEAHVFELECNKMTNSIDEKKKRIALLESSLDEVSGESHKLSCDLKLKETKVKDLEERIRSMESEKHESERVRLTLKEKEDNAVFLGEKVKTCMEELAVLENRIEEANGQNRKLQHSVKIKEDRIANLETR